MFVCINGIIESILKYFSEDFACRVYRASRVHVSWCQFISVHFRGSYLQNVRRQLSERNNAYNSFFIAQVMEISS